MNVKPIRGVRVGALALAVALALPATALAQTDKERELEARIAQLEQLVQTLVSQQQQTSQQVSEQVTKQVSEQVAAATAAKPAAGAMQSARITPNANPNTSFSFGGFIKLDAMLTNTNGGEIADGSAGRLLYLPGAIPVGAADEGTDLDVHSQFSRFWFGADSTLDSGDKLKAYLEFDLFGGALGNEVSTNTYGVTVRHAFASWNNWLAGQTWSNFQDVAALPDAVDFIGPTDGTVFVRQSQVRYTSGGWAVSLENPETIVTPFQGNGGRIASDDNVVPDLIARYTTKGSWGHFSVAGMLRQLKYETTTGIDDSTTGFGVSVSGRYNFDANNDVRFMVNAGQGISRYIGLAISNDAVLDASGKLDTIDMVSGFVGFRHAFTPTVRGNVYYSGAFFDNATGLTGLGITQKVQSVAANVIWSPLPKLDLGVEARYGQRELENGVDGELKRLQFHAKYSF